MASFPISVEFPVHWAELDALGHVNHARIITWMETARIALFESIGLESKAPTNYGPILAHISVDYMAPVHFPAQIVSKARVSKVGRKSFTIEYEVFLSEKPQSPVARGSTVIVLFDYQTQSTVEISDALKMAIGDVHGSPLATGL